jgi:hypothetical protein
MIELVQKKSQIEIISALQSFLLHIVAGVIFFELQIALLSSQVLFGFLFLWLSIPFLEKTKLELGLFIGTLILCYFLNLNNPIWALFLLFAFQFLSSVSDGKTLVLRVLGLLIGSFCLDNYIYVYFDSKDFLSLSAILSFICFFDYFAVCWLRLLLKISSHFKIYDFIEENLELAKDYSSIKLLLEPPSYDAVTISDEEFLKSSYQLNYSLFKYSIVRACGRGNSFELKYKIAMDTIIGVRSQLKNILDQLSLNKTQKSIQNLIEVNHLLVNLHQYYTDYETEIKKLM